MNPQEWQRHLMTQGQQRQPQKRGSNVVDIRDHQTTEINWKQIIGAAAVIGAGIFVWRMY